MGRKNKPGNIVIFNIDFVIGSTRSESLIGLNERTNLLATNIADECKFGQRFFGMFRIFS